MLRFALKTLAQLVARFGNREKLRQKLLERALRAIQEPEACLDSQELARLQNRLLELQEDKKAIQHRMAREKDDSLYEILKDQHRSALTEIEKAQWAIEQRQTVRARVERTSPERTAEDALAQLDNIMGIVNNPKARAEINPLLERLGMWIGLAFGSAIKGNKRLVRRLLSGCIVFGDAPLPVPLFGKDRASVSGLIEDSSSVVCDAGRAEMQASEEGTFPSSETGSSAQPDGCQPEGISITKGNRGDRRFTFPNEFLDMRFFWAAIAQAHDFTADEFIHASRP